MMLQVNHVDVDDKSTINKGCFESHNSNWSPKGFGFVSCSMYIECILNDK